MKTESLVGQVFGRIKVVADLEKRNSRNVSMCLCQCGTEWVVDNRFLKNGNTKSCGKCGVGGNYKHGHGKSAAQSPTYQTWMAMYNRCYNQKQRSYKTYGAVGVTVCESWRADFKTFLADMGERPSGTTLDRIDNSKGYSKSNCRWATSTEQYKNKTVVRNKQGKFSTII